MDELLDIIDLSMEWGLLEARLFVLVISVRQMFGERVRPLGSLHGFFMFEHYLVFLV